MNKNIKLQKMNSAKQFKNIDNNLAAYDLIVYLEGIEDYYFFRKHITNPKVGFRFINGSMLKILQDDLDYFKKFDYRPKIIFIIDKDSGGLELSTRLSRMFKGDIDGIYTIDEVFKIKLDDNTEKFQLENVMSHYKIIPRDLSKMLDRSVLEGVPESVQEDKNATFAHLYDYCKSKECTKFVEDRIKMISVIDKRIENKKINTKSKAYKNAKNKTYMARIIVNDDKLIEYKAELAYKSKKSKDVTRRLNDFYKEVMKDFKKNEKLI